MQWKAKWHVGDTPMVRTAMCAVQSAICIYAIDSSRACEDGYGLLACYTTQMLWLTIAMHHAVWCCAASAVNETSCFLALRIFKQLRVAKLRH